MIEKLSFCVLFLLFAAKSLSQDDLLIVNDIVVIGNRTTKERIILRELTFHTGDTILKTDIDKQLSRSRENVLNTSLFNYVTITDSTDSSGFVGIKIIVEERWYTWPTVVFKYDDRNFSAWLKSKDLMKSKYGFSIDRYNAFGRKENLKLTLLFGYAKQFTISYKNIAIDKNRKHYIGGDIEISRQDEVIVNTKDNEPFSYKEDFHSVFRKNKYTLSYVYRPYINDYHNFYLNYYEYRAADTVIKLNPFFFVDKRNHFECITFDYIFSKDNRDNKAYPLKGSYFELFLGQTISFPFSMNSLSSTTIIPSYYRYYEITKHLYYAACINLKLSYNNNYSYFYSKSFGYTFNLHGFEYNIIEGQYFAVFKNLLKFALLKPRVTEVSFIPLHKFNKIHYALYLNVSSDFGYVNNKYRTPDNDYANKFLYGGGIGIDLATYYDRTLRVDYSINGFGISGFYFHLYAPINAVK